MNRQQLHASLSGEICRMEQIRALIARDTPAGKEDLREGDTCCTLEAKHERGGPSASGRGTPCALGKLKRLDKSPSKVESQSTSMQPAKKVGE